MLYFRRTLFADSSSVYVLKGRDSAIGRIFTNMKCLGAKPLRKKAALPRQWRFRQQRGSPE
ncbi:MAG: hypothetical protein CMH13_10120 [Martelella sp.]|nr:hypothetical protein [Martelella sp.]